MRKESRNDHALLLKDREQLRKKNVCDYFLNQSRYHREWLKRLSQDFKDRNDFGIHPFVLADYYRRPEDIEVALFASLLVSENENIRRQVDHLRRLISDEPYRWFADRGFVTLSVGRNQNKRIDGSSVWFWQVSMLFARLYDIRHQYWDLESAFLQAMRVQDCTAFNAMTYYLADLGIVTDKWWKMNLLLIRLFRRDGLGMGLWGSGDERLHCPLNRNVKEFLGTWFPDYRRVGNAQECIRYFGFDDEVDFFYAYLAYKELQRRKPEECGYYATRYQSWYETGFNPKPYRWRSIMPDAEIKDKSL